MWRPANSDVARVVHHNNLVVKRILQGEIDDIPRWVHQPMVPKDARIVARRVVLVVKHNNVGGMLGAAIGVPDHGVVARHMVVQDNGVLSVTVLMCPVPNKGVVARQECFRHHHHHVSVVLVCVERDHRSPPSARLHPKKLLVANNSLAGATAR